MSRYRKVDPRIWNDQKFRTLSDNGKLTFLFALTHPHMTSLGAMRTTEAGLAEELGWTIKAFREAFVKAMPKAMSKTMPNPDPDPDPDPEKETPPTPSRGPVLSPDDLARLWNEKAPPEMSKVNLPFKRSPKAMTKIKDALKRNPDQGWWVTVIQRMFHSPFLRGEKGWKANIDFMVRKAEEIVDGKYDGAGAPPSPGTPTWKQPDPACPHCKGRGLEPVEIDGDRRDKICRCRR